MKKWRSLAVFPAPFDRQAAEAVAEFEGDEIDTLEGRSLVIYDPDQERFRLHDLMRELAEAGWDKGEAHQVHRRHAAHYLAVAGRARDTYLEGGEGVLEGLRLFDQERVQIEAGQAWAAAHAEEDSEAAVLAQDYPLRAYSVLDLRLNPRECIRWLEASAKSARKLDNRDREGMALNNLGLAYADLGEPRRAIEYYQRHLEIARETGDRRGEGNALGNLGNAYSALEQRDKAITHYGQQLEISRETGDRRGEGNALWNRADEYMKLGRHDEAIVDAQLALKIREEIEDPRADKVRQALADWGAPQD